MFTTCNKTLDTITKRLYALQYEYVRVRVHSHCNENAIHCSNTFTNEKWITGEDVSCGQRSAALVREADSLRGGTFFSLAHVIVVRREAIYQLLGICGLVWRSHRPHRHPVRGATRC